MSAGQIKLTMEDLLKAKLGRDRFYKNIIGRHNLHANEIYNFLINNRLKNGTQKTRTLREDYLDSDHLLGYR